MRGPNFTFMLLHSCFSDLMLLGERNTSGGQTDGRTRETSPLRIRGFTSQRAGMASSASVSAPSTAPAVSFRDVPEFKGVEILALR